MAPMLLHSLWTKSERVASTSLSDPFIDRLLGVDRGERSLSAGCADTQCDSQRDELLFVGHQGHSSSNTAP
jgi:hypothetical protein